MSSNVEAAKNLQLSLFDRIRFGYVFFIYWSALPFVSSEKSEILGRIQMERFI